MESLPSTISCLFILPPLQHLRIKIEQEHHHYTPQQTWKQLMVFCHWASHYMLGLVTTPKVSSLKSTQADRGIVDETCQSAHILYTPTTWNQSRSSSGRSCKTWYEVNWPFIGSYTPQLHAKSWNKLRYPLFNPSYFPYFLSLFS
jgi:hypothetical protein